MPLTLLLPLLLQITPVQPLPKGTGLPPPQSEEEGVMRPVNALFSGIAARDAAAVAETLRPDATMTTASENADGTRRISHATRDTFLARFTPGTERYEERLYDPAIEIDGDIAYVWGRYNFYIDGKLHHCGYDHFDVVRENGSWKIQNITWSSRTTGCDTQ
jgi:ketosteroid isomerase-like protein